MEELGWVLLTYLILATAVAVASTTLTRAALFRPARDWLKPRSWLLYKLASCPYCLAHWLSLPAAGAAIFNITEITLINFLVTWLWVVGLSSFLIAGLLNWFHMSETYISELEDSLRTALAAMPDEDEKTEWRPVNLPKQGQLITGRNEEGGTWTERFDIDEPIGRMVEWKPEVPD